MHVTHCQSFHQKLLPLGNSSGIITFRKDGAIMGLGDFIRAKRKQKNWSQRDLAAAAGISNAEISRIEAGKRKEPSTSVLKEIAKALDTPFEELLLEAGVIEKSKNFVDTFLEKHGSEPISSFSASSSKPTMPDDLTEDELQEVMIYIDFIRSKRK